MMKKDKEYESMKLEIFSLTKRCNQQKELLIDIEWINMDGEGRCLFCDGKQPQHAADCELDAECNG